MTRLMDAVLQRKSDQDNDGECAVVHEQPMRLVTKIRELTFEEESEECSGDTDSEYQ